MSVWVLERGNMNQAVLSNKQAQVTEISDKIKNSQSTVVCEYRGLSVAEVTELRRNLRAEGVDFKVYKNTMFERACDNCGFEDLKDALSGPNAFAFSEDATAPARILAKFAKKHKALVLKKGIVEGKVVDEATIKELSLLPGRDGMLSMLLSCLQAPVSSFEESSRLLPKRRSLELLPHRQKQLHPQLKQHLLRKRPLRNQVNN